MNPFRQLWTVMPLIPHLDPRDQVVNVSEITAPIRDISRTDAIRRLTPDQEGFGSWRSPKGRVCTDQLHLPRWAVDDDADLIQHDVIQAFCDLRELLFVKYDQAAVGMFLSRSQGEVKQRYFLELSRGPKRHPPAASHDKGSEQVYPVARKFARGIGAKITGPDKLRTFSLPASITDPADVRFYTAQYANEHSGCTAILGPGPAWMVWVFTDQATKEFINTTPVLPPRSGQNLSPAWRPMEMKASNVPAALPDRNESKG